MNALPNDERLFKTITDLHTVDPKQAQEWLLSNNFRRNRPLRQWHASRLAEEMKEGRFTQGSQIHFAQLHGSLYLVNGQHTLAAIVESGLPQLLSVMITVVCDEDQIAELYFRHDTHLTRKLADALNATALPDAWGVTPTQLQKVGAASLYLEWLLGKISKTDIRNMTNDKRLQIISKYRSEGLFALRVFDGALNKFYFTRRSTFSTVMFCSHHPATEEFWRSIVTDDGLRQGTPQKTLLDFLKDTTLPGGTSLQGRKRTVGEHMVVKGISHAWNAFLARSDLKIIRPSFESKVATFDEVGQLRVA